MLTFSQPATAAPAIPSRSSGETKRPSLGLEHDVGREQAERQQRLGAVDRRGLGSGSSVVLSTPQRTRPAAPSPSDSSGSARRRASRATVRRLELELGAGRARPRARRAAAGSSVDAAARRPGGARPTACRKRTVASSSALGPASSTHSTRRWSKVVAAALRVGGRVDDPERGRGRVLGRARRVGVERVALVEQRARRGSRRRRPSARLRRASSSVARPRRVEGRQPASSALQPLAGARACRRGPGPSRRPGSGVDHPPPDLDRHPKRGERSQGIWTICSRPSSSS